MVLPLRAALVAACAVLATAGSATATTAPIVTVAGNGQFSPFPAPASGGSFTPATSVPISSAAGIATIPATFFETFQFADPLDNRILQVTSNGQISVVAGTGAGGHDGENVNPVDARLLHPKGVALDSVGSVVADTDNYCVRRISGGGLGDPRILTDAGSCDPGVATLGGPGTPPTLGSPANANDVETWPGTGDVEPSYYTASSIYVFAVSGSGGSRNIAIAAGSNSTSTPPADNTSPTSGAIGMPADVSIGSSQTTYFIASSDQFTGLNRVFKVTGGKIFTVAGLGTGPLGDGGAATAATLSNPTGVLALADGGFLVYDGGHARIRRVTGGGMPTIDTIAGNGVAGGSPDGTAADAASLRPYGRLALAPSGLLFTQMANGVGGLVRKIPATAIVSGPSGAVSSASASFGLASWDQNATYACRIDLGSFGACGSYSNLTDGSHTFQARATTNGTLLDTAGTTRTWTVDTTPPADFALVSPDDGATVAPQPNFTWQAATDATTSVARYELWIDGAKTAEITSCCAVDAPAKLGDGTHSWQVRAFDQAGNERDSATRSFKVNTPPVAMLTIGPSRALVGRVVTFDGTGSSDDNGTVTRYQWDLDGDSVFETDTGGSSRITRTYNKPQTLTIGVRVTDNDGLTGTTSGQLVVTTAAPAGKQLGVSINDGAQYTNDPDVTVFAVWPAFASNALVSNDGGFKLAQTFPVAETIAWKLDSSGPERLPKTIYVRFLGGTQTSETYQDDIILDQIPPKVASATVAGAASAASAAKSRLVKLKIKATDSNSGVGGLQVTGKKRRPGKLLKYRKTIKVKPAKVLYVRARDRAGNFSAWRKVKR